MLTQMNTRSYSKIRMSNSSRLHALQIFVERQAALAPKKTRPRFSQQVPGIIAKSAREIFPAKNSSANWRTWSRVVSTRQRFGIYRQEIAHRTLPRSGKTNESTPNDEDVPHEEVYLWACRFLGYGIRWSRHRLFKSVLPSISVYPTIYEFNNPSINRIMESGTVSDVQEFFRRGELHPFTRDCYGQSLLHVRGLSIRASPKLTDLQVAALHHRSDICRLLGQIGLKADADFAGWTPTDDAVVGRSLHADDDIKVRSTLKSLAQDSYLIDGTDRYDIFGFLFHLSPENMVWCWKHRADILYYEDTSVLASMFVEALLSHLSRRETMTSACQSLKEFFSVELRHLLESGSIRVFNYIFDSMEWRGGVTDSRSFESFEIGEAFIRTIADVGVDVNGFIETEKAKLPTRRLDPNPSPFHETSGERSLVAEHIPHRGWKLGWKWQFDKSQPGYLLVTELTSLVVEPGPWTLAEFPFCRRYNRSGLEEARHWKARNLRFERRTAAKARKERARVGLKQPRGKMPGSWIS